MHLTCLPSADCFLAVTGTLGMKAAAPLHGLWTVACGEVGPSASSISQQSGGSCSLIVWKSSFQFWVGGVSMSDRYSLLKNCHITNRASVDPQACLESHRALKCTFKKQTGHWSYLLRNFIWFWLWYGWQEDKKNRIYIIFHNTIFRVGKRNTVVN